MIYDRERKVCSKLKAAITNRFGYMMDWSFGDIIFHDPGMTINMTIHKDTKLEQWAHLTIGFGHIQQKETTKMKSYNIFGGEMIGPNLYTNQILTDGKDFAMPMEEVMRRVEDYPRVLGESISARSKLSRIKQDIKDVFDER